MTIDEERRQGFDYGPLVVCGPDGTLWTTDGGRDPGDRLGGPYSIHWAHGNEGFPDDPWFLFFDTSFGHWPTCAAVRARSSEAAYEILTDMYPRLEIPREDWKDYGVETDEPTCDYRPNGGEPIDTSYLQGGAGVFTTVYHPADEED